MSHAKKWLAAVEKYSKPSPVIAISHGQETSRALIQFMESEDGKAAMALLTALNASVFICADDGSEMCDIALLLTGEGLKFSSQDHGYLTRPEATFRLAKSEEIPNFIDRYAKVKSSDELITKLIKKLDDIADELLKK